MRILLLYNPIAGRGQSHQAADMLRSELSAAGHAPEMMPTRREPASTWLDDALAEIDLLVVLGGDGAIRQSLGSASRTGVPIYQFPFGTENLFAREFGMNREADRLRLAIEHWAFRTIDLGKANGRWFGLMASVGLDAEVVHHLAAIRSGTISHRSYIMPTFKQFMRWRGRPFEVMVDGERIDNGACSFVVVGNSRQYGWRINPAYLADMSDGLLDVAVFPVRSRTGLARWALLARTGRLSRARTLIYKRGKSVEIRHRHAFRYQLDGDPPGEVDGSAAGDSAGDPHDRETDVLRIEVVPAALSVLVPAQTSCCDQTDAAGAVV